MIQVDTWIISTLLLPCYIRLYSSQNLKTKFLFSSISQVPRDKFAERPIGLTVLSELINHLAGRQSPVMRLRLWELATWSLSSLRFLIPMWFLCDTSVIPLWFLLTSLISLLLTLLVRLVWLLIFFLWRSQLTLLIPLGLWLPLIFVSRGAPRRVVDSGCCYNSVVTILL